MMFLPPISSEQCLNSGAHACAISFPTAVEPVKLITGASICEASGAPAFGPSPLTRFTHPAGVPASASVCTRWYEESGVSSAGLSTTVLPLTSAGIIFHDGIAIGKFHGVTGPATPMHWRPLIENLFGNSDGVV